MSVSGDHKYFKKIKKKQNHSGSPGIRSFWNYKRDRYMNTHELDNVLHPNARAKENLYNVREGYLKKSIVFMKSMLFSRGNESMNELHHNSRLLINPQVISFSTVCDSTQPPGIEKPPTAIVRQVEEGSDLAFSPQVQLSDVNLGRKSYCQILASIHSSHAFTSAKKQTSSLSSRIDPSEADIDYDEVLKLLIKNLSRLKKPLLSMQAFFKKLNSDVTTTFALLVIRVICVYRSDSNKPQSHTSAAATKHKWINVSSTSKTNCEEFHGLSYQYFLHPGLNEEQTFEGYLFDSYDSASSDVVSIAQSFVAAPLQEQSSISGVQISQMATESDIEMNSEEITSLESISEIHTGDILSFSTEVQEEDSWSQMSFSGPRMLEFAADDLAAIAALGSQVRPTLTILLDLPSYYEQLHTQDTDFSYSYSEREISNLNETEIEFELDNSDEFGPGQIENNVTNPEKDPNAKFEHIGGKNVIDGAETEKNMPVAHEAVSRQQSKFSKFDVDITGESTEHRYNITQNFEGDLARTPTYEEDFDGDLKQEEIFNHLQKDQHWTERYSGNCVLLADKSIGSVITGDLRIQTEDENLESHSLIESEVSEVVVLESHKHQNYNEENFRDDEIDIPVCEKDQTNVLLNDPSGNPDVVYIESQKSLTNISEQINTKLVAPRISLVSSKREISEICAAQVSEDTENFTSFPSLDSSSKTEKTSQDRGRFSEISENNFDLDLPSLHSNHEKPSGITGISNRSLLHAPSVVHVNSKASNFEISKSVSSHMTHKADYITSQEPKGRFYEPQESQIYESISDSCVTSNSTNIKGEDTKSDEHGMPHSIPAKDYLPQETAPRDFDGNYQRGIIHHTFNPCTKSKRAWADYDSESEDFVYEEFFSSFEDNYYFKKPLPVISEEVKNKVKTFGRLRRDSPNDLQTTGSSFASDLSFERKQEAATVNELTRISLAQLFDSATPTSDATESTSRDPSGSSPTNVISETNMLSLLNSTPKRHDTISMKTDNTNEDTQPKSKMMNNAMSMATSDDLSESHRGILSVEDTDQFDIDNLPNSKYPNHFESEDVEDISENCRRELFVNTQAWMKTELLLLELTTERFASSQYIPSTVRFENVPSDISSQANSSEISTDDSHSEDELVEIDELNTLIIAQILRNTIKEFKVQFTDLVNDYVMPCDNEIGKLIKEILELRKDEWEIFSLGSGLSNEIAIMSHATSCTDSTEWTRLNEKFKACEDALHDLDEKMNKNKAQLLSLHRGFRPRIDQISDGIDEICTRREQTLASYSTFFEINSAQNRFGTLDIHKCTHVSTFESKTLWHLHVDTEELEELLTDNISSLLRSNNSVGAFIASIHEAVKTIRIPDSMQSQMGEETPHPSSIFEIPCGVICKGYAPTASVTPKQSVKRKRSRNKSTRNRRCKRKKKNIV